jgi:hypothetical protein
MYQPRGSAAGRPPPHADHRAAVLARLQEIALDAVALARLTSGPISVAGSIGSPTCSAPTAAASASTTSS